MRAKAASDPPERIIRVYAFDPSRGARFENHLTTLIPFEKLKALRSAGLSAMVSTQIKEDAPVGPAPKPEFPKGFTPGEVWIDYKF